MPHLDEAQLEITTVNWLRELGFEYRFGPDISPEGDCPLRSDYGQVVLAGRLKEAIERFNPDIPAEALEDGMRQVLRPGSPSLIENNRNFHAMLAEGVDVSWFEQGRQRHDKLWLIDTDDLENNDWLVVNQFTVVEGRRQRRPDVVVFVNGLPLVVIELKNPADEKATMRHAFNQLQTYKRQIPSLFVYNAVVAVSDGMQARMGTLTAGWDRFMPWRTIDGTDLYREPGNEKQTDGQLQPGLQTLIKGMFDKRLFLDYILNFITFEDDGGGSASIAKKAAAYHQYHAANRAVECTLEAAAQSGDQRIGVVWHTQGSGKSLSMVFYAGKIARHRQMANPTIVVITDRNDLDGQLYGTFAINQTLLRQRPVQAQDRAHLRELLSVASGGIVFTTIQKFFPENKGDTHRQLSDRRNIVVIADEAHRSQYDFIDGFARHMHDALPSASFIGFTGTPIETTDKSTPAVFGEYIDKYDILRAVEDGATVPIYYESRLAKIELKEDERPKIEQEFEQITEAEEEQTRKQRMKTKWASLEAMVGSEKRIALVAADLLEHFEQRQEAMAGKALVVCMSRRICVDMYDAIVKLRPDWHSDDDAMGKVKIVMSGSASDDLSWQRHVRTKKGREAIAKRFKSPGDELEIVIVRDMWLTGFDCPSMHTMYVDKPMGGHNLMQAIARVNRVFRDKPGGLVVDYLGIADALKRALANYTASGGKGQATIDQEQAVAVMLEKYEVVCDMLHGFDYKAILQSQSSQRMSGIAEAMDFILSLKDGKKRYLQAVTALSQAFALAVPNEKAIAIRDEIGLFQEIRSSLVKATVSKSEKSPDEMESAIRQLVSRAISSTEVVDIFTAAGLTKPDISILSDDFLAEVRQLPQRNLALELLKKLINDEIKVRMRKNVVQARSFTEMLEEAVRKYQNRAIEAAEVIEELIALAKEMRQAQKRGEDLGLSDDEVAFYDALEVNDSAVQVLGDDTLKLIAQELVKSVKNSVSVDWTKRENARAQIRVMVKRILRRYGYPPDKQAKATELVLTQAETLCKDWAVAG